MRIEGDYVYAETGDLVEIYDGRGVFTGLARTVQETDDITFWPERNVEFAIWRLVGQFGQSVITSFDFPQIARRGMYVTVLPVARLPRERRDAW